MTKWYSNSVFDKKHYKVCKYPDCHNRVRSDKRIKYCWRHKVTKNGSLRIGNLRVRSDKRIRYCYRHRV